MTNENFKEYHRKVRLVENHKASVNDNFDKELHNQMQRDLINLFRKSASSMYEESNQLIEKYADDMHKLDARHVEILKGLLEPISFVGYGDMAFSSGVNACQRFINAFKQPKGE
jgi:hypothetical protein